MALRKSRGPTATSASERTQPRESQKFATSPENEKRIDDFIRNNPKRFDYYNSLPKERLVRAAMLKDLEAQERAKRTRSAILRKLDADPEIEKSLKVNARHLL